jgi:hypothetical protein
MANIKLEDLTGHKIAGVDLFSDSESFMQELSENELVLYGGGKELLPTPPMTAIDKIPAPTPPIFNLP